jgi:peroxiredoxin Q/BCP
MRSFTTLLIAALCAGADGAAQEGKKGELQIGDLAPAFQSTDANGLTWKSADHVGKKYIVVYFYPGDFTPGCTAQAQKFRDQLRKLYDAGAEVVGVSGDSAKTHALFQATYKLSFPLVADEKGELARQFGVPVGPGAKVKTRLPDKTPLTFERAVTTARWTFVIGMKGEIVYKNTKVDPVRDSQQVADFLKKLEKE